MNTNERQMKGASASDAAAAMRRAPMRLWMTCSRFEPIAGVEQGIGRFVNWYKIYYIDANKFDRYTK
jgi:hypothetical protein